MSKWTKEQIESARAILRNHGCGSEEDECSCAFCHNLCPFLLGEGFGPSYEKFSGEYAQLIKKLIAQHEHDADVVPPEGYSGVTPSAEGQNSPFPANMSVHDYWRYQFAGMALQGFLASHEYVPDLISRRAIEYADELLKQLEGGK